MNKGWMYILKCADGSYYTGSTTNIERRLKEHQAGEGANHTKKRLPVKLMYVEDFQRIDEAFNREKQVQGWSRKKKEALINKTPEKLHGLAKCLNDTTHIGFDSAQPTDSVQPTNNKRSLSEAETKESTQPTDSVQQTNNKRSLSEAETKESTQPTDSVQQTNNKRSLSEAETKESNPPTDSVQQTNNKQSLSEAETKESTQPTNSVQQTNNKRSLSEAETKESNPPTDSVQPTNNKRSLSGAEAKENTQPTDSVQQTNNKRSLSGAETKENGASTSLSHLNQNKKDIERSRNAPKLRFPEFRNDEEWEETSLGNIGKPLMCKRILKEQTSAYSNNSIPFYKIGTFGKTADAFIPISLYQNFKSKYSFPNIGDILISASGTIGRLVVYNGLDAYFQDSNIVWLGHKEDDVINPFLYYCYSTLNWQTSDGGVIKRLYNNNLKEMIIYYPKNLKEQQKIADCLSSLDNLITAETKKQDYLEDHKKGLMQKLFPAENNSGTERSRRPQYRFPEFKKDGDWNIKPLEKVFSIFQGYTFSSKDSVDKGTRWLKIADVGIQKMNNNNPSFLPSDFIKTYDKFSLKKGNYVLALTRPILNGELKISAVDDLYHNSLLNQRVGKLVSKENLKLVYYLLQTQYLIGEIEKSIAGSEPPNLSMKQIENISIVIPKNPKEQQKIANCLSSVDDLIELQTTKIEALKKHKKGLMQQLFPEPSRRVFPNVNDVAL